MSSTQSEHVQAEQGSTPLVETASAPSNKSRRNVLVIVGVLAATLCLCIGACVIIAGSGMVRAALERDDVEQVIYEFMSAMARRDTDAAYALFSTRAQRHVSLSQIEELLEGNNFVLFDGYQSASVMNLNLSAAFNTNPDLPQGTVAKVNGVVTYEGGYTGSFNAMLEQEKGEWRLFNIHVTVPPNKLEK